MAFTRRCTIVVQSSQITGTLTDYPVLIKITHADLRTISDGGYVADSNGYDIRPESNSILTIPLAFELVAYSSNGTNGTFIAYAKISSIAVGSTYYLGFGDAALNTNASSTSTWRSEYKGVWHGTTLNDSTSNANTLTFGGSGSSANASGKIAGAFSFNGSGWATAGDASPLDINGAISYSCWFSIDTTSPATFPINKKDSTTGIGYELLQFAGGGTLKGRAKIGSTDYEASSVLGVLPSVFLLAAAVINDSFNDFTTYANGFAPFSGTAITPGTMSNTTEFQIGARQGGNRMIGLVEEVRVYAGLMSALWLIADYNCQSAPGSFASYTFDAAPSTGFAHASVIICG